MNLPKELDGAFPWEIRVVKALVPLTVELPSIPNGPGWWITSGFLIEIGARWFWMTANHSLDELEELFAKYPDAKPELRPLTDQTYGGIAFKYDPELRINPWAMATDLIKHNPEEYSPYLEAIQSLDIACLELRSYYRRHLTASSCLPFGEGDLWHGTVEFCERLLESTERGFFIVGLPVSGLHIASDMDLKGMEVKKLAVWPSAISSPVMEFDPMWRPETHEGSVKGMSGAPAVAVVDGDLYWFGVQSSEVGVPGKRPKTVKIALATMVFRMLNVVDRVVSAATFPSSAQV